MGLFGKFMDSMRIDSTDDDDYYDEDEVIEEAPRKGIFTRKNDQKDEYDYDEPEQKKGLFSSKNQQTTPARRQMEVAMVKPTSVDDGRTIVDALLSGKAVVLNMEGIQTEMAQRILDFTSGAVYSMNGKLQMISNYIFIATPYQVALSGDFGDLFATGQLDISGANMRF